MIAYPFLREAQININSALGIYFTGENYTNKWINLCMNDKRKKKGVDKLLLVVAVVDSPLNPAVVDAWDPLVSPKLKKNTKPKLVIHYRHFQ